MPAGSTSLQWTATVIRFSIMLAGPAVGLPVEVLPEDVDAVDDAAELEGAVGRVPQLVERAELREVAETVLCRLGHGHLVGHEAAVALAGMDPEPLRRLLREEPGRLPGGHRAEEEPRGEADGARAGCDEVRQIAERTQIAEPALAREELSERCPGHEL